MVQRDETNEDLVIKFRKRFGNNDLVFGLLDNMPYMVGIFDPSGLLVYCNKKFHENYDLAYPPKIVGHYNVLKDTYILDVIGTRKLVESVFKGKSQTLKDFKTPLEEIRYARNKNFIDEVRIHDISGHAIFDNNEIVYLVFISHITNIYSVNKVVLATQEYIHKNWLESFKLESLVKTVGLSSSQLIRVFKKYTKMTPYEYYKNVKIRKLKEKLRDPNIRIADAFIECGLDYCGRYKQFFKASVGMTPYEYWQKNSIKILK